VSATISTWLKYASIFEQSINKRLQGGNGDTATSANRHAAQCPAVDKIVRFGARYAEPFGSLFDSK